MRVKRWTLIGLCLIAVFAMTSTDRSQDAGRLVRAAATQAAAPRWWVKETGSLVSYNENSGLTELKSPETLESQGELQVFTHRHPPNEPPRSDCIVKDRESIEDPSNGLLPGTGAMEEFEVVCEKGSGPLNAGQPSPCGFGEGFELKGASLNWPSTLEETVGLHGPEYFDHFTGVDIEVDCLKAKTLTAYTGSLRPQVRLGRLEFLGPASGELENASTGERFYLGSMDVIEPVKYKDVRVR